MVVKWRVRCNMVDVSTYRVVSSILRSYKSVRHGKSIGHLLTLPWINLLNLLRLHSQSNVGNAVG